MIKQKHLDKLQAVRDAGARAAREGKHEYRDNPYDPYAVLKPGENYLASEACKAETWRSGYLYQRRVQAAAMVMFNNRDTIW